MLMIPVIDVSATGQNIARLRAAAGLSVKDLQSVLGFANPQAIYKWQNGLCLPSLDNMVILAAALDVSVDEIIVLRTVSMTA
jgi:transcriptional regulator with XRE-family HTH domain